MGGDWTKASALVDLLAAVVESESGPLMARQELVAQTLEAGLKLSNDTKGATDANLLAAFLFLDVSSVEALLARNDRADAQSNASGREDRNDGSVSGGGDGTEEVSSLYKVARVVEEYERLTGKTDPPRKFETVAKWKAFHARCKPLPEHTHLSFHIKVVDILGMLAKGDNFTVEQWCSLFIPECEMVSGVALRHPALKGCFLRYMHGIYFSRPASVASSSSSSADRPGEGGGDVDAEDRADAILVRHQSALVSVFSEFKIYLKLLHRLQLDSATDAMTAGLFEEQEDFEHVVVDVVLPFLKDFFSGTWPLLPPPEPVDLRNSVAAGERVDDELPGGRRGSGAGGHDTPPSSHSSQARSERSHSSADSKGTTPKGTPKGGGVVGGEATLLWKCARHPSSIVHQLAKLAKHSKIQKWENARVGVLEALVAARSRRVGGDETAAGQGFGGRHAPTASSDELMVPPESSLSASVGEAERLIEQFVA